MKLREELEARGLLHQFTDDQIFPVFDKGGETFYFGVDPSADSMTIGNFVALMQAIHVMLRGNTCYLLVGGATGMIGNPTGKDKERNFLDAETLAKNQKGIHSDFERLCDNVMKVTGKKLNFTIVNNYDWFKNMNYLEFLRTVGKSMTVNRMMNKDIVKKRINDPEKSISYAEFSYMLIMGYDFYVLNKEYGVTLEVGGSDERDGILAGVEITSKLSGNTVYGMTNKLILDSTGKKFGKSEGNAIWLNPEKNSPYFVYQYFMNVTDEDVNRYLKLFTFLDLETIDQITKKHLENPQLRMGQSQLAHHVVELIFGVQEAETAHKVTEILFGDPEESLALLQNSTPAELKSIGQELGPYTLSNEEKNLIKNGELRLIDLCTASGLTPSNGEAKKLIQSGALFVNNKKSEAVDSLITTHDIQNNAFLLLRKGKKNYKIIFC